MFSHTPHRPVYSSKVVTFDEFLTKITEYINEGLPYCESLCQGHMTQNCLMMSDQIVYTSHIEPPNEPEYYIYTKYECRASFRYFMMTADVRCIQVCLHIPEYEAIIRAAGASVPEFSLRRAYVFENVAKYRTAMQKYAKSKGVGFNCYKGAMVNDACVVQLTFG
jgi:hypothetical protein